MRSPRADAELVTRTIDDVEVDLCPETGGVWFDPGELGKLADDPKYADRALEPSGDVPPQGLACPRCNGGSLHPHTAGGIYQVHRCPACAGVWVDGDVARAIAGRVSGAEVEDIEREAEMTHKAIMAEQGLDLIEDSMGGGLIRGLGSLLGRLF